MAQRGNKRESMPLSPNRSVVVVSGGVCTELSASQIDKGAVGMKAWGLLSLPEEWGVPLFVVDGTKKPSPKALTQALKKIDADKSKRLIVRSSGTDETLQSRGSLSSKQCRNEELQSVVAELQDQYKSHEQSVHWIVQTCLLSKAQGHLSNERRLSQHHRDWVIEIEPKFQNTGEIHGISLRKWRKDNPIVVAPMNCIYREQILESLELIAQWGYERLIRAHVEWVWDGQKVNIVQIDESPTSTGGVDPKTKKAAKKAGKIKKEPDVAEGNLSVFQHADDACYKRIRKLKNVEQYRKLGYQSYKFFVLDDEQELKRIIGGEISPEVCADLEILTNRPFVIRTSLYVGAGSAHLPMLPRSEELRSPEKVKSWLLGDFRDEILKLEIDPADICLIGHHFVPAISSAWCRASPDKRRVRIESLWGIPEGLYYYSYDSFDVDTSSSHVELTDDQPEDIKIRERLRFKENFIAPNANGEWVFQQANEKADWSNSMMKDEWVKSVAWDTRRLASLEGKCVTAMWFIGVDEEHSVTPILPWYHEFSEDTIESVPANPRRKGVHTDDFVIRSKADKDNLERMFADGKRVPRVILQPLEESIVRNRQFAKEIGELSAQHGFVVELHGGILSHAYYLLTQAGCRVECKGLDSGALAEEVLEFNKLVRDKVPEKINQHGEDVLTLELQEAALIRALRDKAIEEATEVADAKATYQLVEEIADLYDVVRELMRRLEIKPNEVLQASVRKSRKRGSFKDGKMLVNTSLQPFVSASEGDSLLELSGNEKNDGPRVISDEVGLPKSVYKMHVDSRSDQKGMQWKELTCSLPIGFSSLSDSKDRLVFEGANGKDVSLRFSIELTRSGSEVKTKVVLGLTPEQLPLPFND